jgi:DNA-binding FrmR family transcriptional regulator
MASFLLGLRARGPKQAYTPYGILVKTFREIFYGTYHPGKEKVAQQGPSYQGQVEAIERDLEQEAECTRTLHGIAACRGAMDALMAEVIEGHVRFHVLDPRRSPTREQSRAAQDLIGALKAYLR